MHQVRLDGSGWTAWPLTFLPDPIDRERQGATVIDLEGVLSYLRVQDAIQRRMGQGSDEEEGDEAPPVVKDKKKKKRKGKGKGEADD